MIGEKIWKIQWKKLKNFVYFLDKNKQDLIELKNEMHKLDKYNPIYQEVINRHIISTAKKKGFYFTDKDLKNYQKEITYLCMNLDGSIK